MQFDEFEAVKYGVDEAIMINNFRFWILKNKANDKHFYEGRYWTYNSAPALKKLFPFWSVDKIKRIIKSLENKKVILKGNFNKVNYDRTNWYAFLDENVLERNNNTIVQNCTMDSAKLHDGTCESARPIPDSYTYNNSTNTLTPYLWGNEKKEEKSSFKKPTIEEVKEYCSERKNGIDAEAFWHFYESKNWMIGKSKMKSWHSAMVTWEKSKGFSITEQRKKEKAKQEVWTKTPEESLLEMGIGIGWLDRDMNK